MGLENNYTAGNQGSNFNWQLKMLQELDSINKSIQAGGGSGVDYELRITQYKANKVGTGYTTGDFISRTDVLNAGTGAIVSTLWFNETQATTIGVPPIADLDPYLTPGAVAGDVANAAIDLGNPVKVGGRAATADPTAVTDGQRVNALYTKLGKLVVMPYALPENFVSGATTDITTTAATTVVGGVASTNLYITHLVVMNSHATTGTWVNLTEETSGTILYTVYAAPAGGGASVTLPIPLKIPTAGKAFQATCVTTGTNVRVSASGYKSV